MSSIKFTLSESESWDKLSQIWSCLSIGKQKGKIDREEMKKTLGSKLKIKFWSVEEASEIGKKWFEIPDQERISHPEFFEKWDFESWLGAIEDAEVSLNEIVRKGNEGELLFEQFSQPSGGIDPLLFLIEIVDGRVISMDD